MPNLWDVYYIHTTPADGLVGQAKPKFHVVVSEEPLVSFVISTDTPAHLLRGAAKPCFVKVSCSTNPFLEYDSWLSLNIAFTIPEARYYDQLYRGVLCQQSRALVKNAVLACSVLKTVHRKPVCDALGLPHA